MPRPHATPENATHSPSSGAARTRSRPSASTTTSADPPCSRISSSARARGASRPRPAGGGPPSSRSRSPICSPRRISARARAPACLACLRDSFTRRISANHPHVCHHCACCRHCRRLFFLLFIRMLVRVEHCACLGHSEPPDRAAGGPQPGSIPPNARRSSEICAAS